MPSTLTTIDTALKCLDADEARRPSDHNLRVRLRLAQARALLIERERELDATEKPTES